MELSRGRHLCFDLSRESPGAGETGRNRAIALLADGSVLSRSELEAAGVPKSTVTRMIADGTLFNVGTRSLCLADCAFDQASMMAGIAARFGGRPDEPKGVVCLTAAAILHGLLDLAFDQLADGLDVAVARGRSAAKGGLPVTVRTWNSLPGTRELEWREFAGRGIHVTSAPRTVVDMFAPAHGVPQQHAMEAVARLVHLGSGPVGAAVEMARGVPHGKQVHAAVQTIRTALAWNPGKEDDVEDQPSGPGRGP